jgi:hypothetical protein
MADRMSYDFMMMKPKADVMAEIESLEDLGEHTLLRQDPAALVEALSALFPELSWSKENDGAWFGWLDGDDTRYEFRIGPEPDYSWSIFTSRRTNTRRLVPIICDRLGLLAFDGQANLLIWPAGYSSGG